MQRAAQLVDRVRVVAGPALAVAEVAVVVRAVGFRRVAMRRPGDVELLEQVLAVGLRGGRGVRSGRGRRRRREREARDQRRERAKARRAARPRDGSRRQGASLSVRDATRAA